MFIVSVMYPAGVRFDAAYYADAHARLVHDRWDPMGLRSMQVLRGLPGPDGKPPLYQVVTHLTFDSQSAFEAAAGQHAPEIFADIPKFTDGSPVVQFNEPAA